MLSNGFVVIPAVTAASNGAEPALQLPNSALISAGGLPAVVSGTAYSVLPSNQGLFVNGANAPSIPQLSSTSPSLSIFTVGGQAFTASPGGFPLAGTSLLPGGSPLTISGTVVLLGQGALRIGSTTMLLSPDSSEVFTVGDQAFTAAPTEFSIGGTSLFPGGQTVTVSGTPVFLDGSSHLKIGSTTVYRTWGFSLIEFDTNPEPGFDNVNNDHATSWLLHGSDHRHYHDWKYVVDNRARRTNNSCTSSCGYNSLESARYSSCTSFRSHSSPLSTVLGVVRRFTSTCSLNVSRDSHFNPKE